MYLPQGGFVPKYDQKLECLLGAWVASGHRERSCNSCQESELGFFAPFSFGDFWRGRETEMGLSRSCRGELEVPTEQESYLVGPFGLILLLSLLFVFFCLFVSLFLVF